MVSLLLQSITELKRDRMVRHVMTAYDYQMSFFMDTSLAHSHFQKNIS